MTLTNVAIVLFLTLLTEMLVEHFVGKPLERVYPELDRWWVMYIALAAGGAISYFSGVNLFEGSLPAMLGVVLTALIVGGGSKLAHDVTNMVSGAGHQATWLLTK